MTEVVASWTGGQADALRQALRMTNESFAERLGIGVRTVAYWRKRPDLLPRPAMQEILDAALAQAPEPARAQFFELAAAREQSRGQVAAVALPSAPDDLASLMDWLTQTDTSDEAISSLDRLATALAEAHTQVAPASILAEVKQLQRTAQNMLRNGKHRPSQARELLRINGSLLAHQSLLLSDLEDYRAAESLRPYGPAVPAGGRSQPGHRMVRPGEDRPMAKPLPAGSRLRPARTPAQLPRPDEGPARLL